MKRFYKLVSVEKADGGYHILLDGRAVKRKAGPTLKCLNENIANRIMQEWAEQKDEIIPDNMPFTQIENTRLDRVAVERDAMSANIFKYLNTDLLCYTVDATKELVKLQDDAWAPWRTWFENKFGVTLQTTNSLAAIQQDEKAHKAAAQYIESLDDVYFTILQIIVPLSGSLVLGVAFIEGAANADDIFKAAYVEEDYKAVLYDADKYGNDPLIEKQQKATRRELEAAFEYLSYL
jgi:chaperone required for assembly of F1-ATPase